MTFGHSFGGKLGFASTHPSDGGVPSAQAAVLVVSRHAIHLVGLVPRPTRSDRMTPSSTYLSLRSVSWLLHSTSIISSFVPQDSIIPVLVAKPRHLAKREICRFNRRAWKYSDLLTISYENKKTLWEKWKEDKTYKNNKILLKQQISLIFVKLLFF